VALASGDTPCYSPGNSSDDTRGFIVSSTAEKTRETRLRRMADRQELRLAKSRRRDPRATDYDRYALLTPGNAVKFGAASRRGQLVFTASLDDIERWLTDDAR
jgi:hypothetical protein